jgi:hypothetical protein
MLSVGVAACNGYGVCTVRCIECDCMVCVLFGVLSVPVWCVYFSLC